MAGKRSFWAEDRALLEDGQQLRKAMGFVGATASNRAGLQLEAAEVSSR